MFSEQAEQVELCLFDPKGRHELQRVPLREQTDLIWHGYLPEARPGWFYGYRVYGPYAPTRRRKGFASTTTNYSRPLRQGGLRAAALERCPIRLQDRA